MPNIPILTYLDGASRQRVTPPAGAARRLVAPAGSGWGRLRDRAAAVLVLAVQIVAAGTAPPAAQARRVVVGAGGDHATVEAAINGITYGAGDTIAILPGTYDVAAMLQPRGSGAAGSPIVVRGIGTAPVIRGAALNSKALWDVEQNNHWWVFENLVVADMRGSQTNARGFFLVNCTDVVIQDCEVRNCWNGFMSSGTAARVTIQFCDIHDNGGLVGPAHNLYLSGGEDFVVQHNWIHDAHYGTCFKDRTRNLALLYNWIENADQGGYEVSLAGYGTQDRGLALLLGNVIVKSPTSSQRTHFLRYEDGRVGTLALVNNTLVARAGNTVVYSIASTTTLRNNVFAGGATLFASDSPNRVLAGTDNWISSGTSVAAGLAGTLTGSAPGFVNQAGGDLHLASGSPCIDAGDGQSPLPVWQYVSSADREARDVFGAGIDLGAFESASGDPPPPSDTTPPDAPPSLTATAVGTNRIDLAWSAPDAADLAGYRILRAAGAGGPFDLLASSSTTSWSDSGLSAATTYFYQVCARDTAGNISSPSPTASATTDELPPPAADSLAVTVVQGTRVRGGGADLAADDGFEIEIASALAGRSPVAEWTVDVETGTGSGTLQLGYEGRASATVTQKLFLWRWKTSKWSQVDNVKVGPTAQLRSKVLKNPGYFVDAGGRARLRVLQSGRSAFHVMADLVSLQIVPLRMASGIAGAGAGAGPAEASNLSSLHLVQGKVVTGDVSILAVQDGRSLAVASAAPAGAKSSRMSAIEWRADATLAAGAAALRVGFAASASSRVETTLYLYRWGNESWKAIDSRPLDSAGVQLAADIESAFPYVSSNGEVRVRVVAQGSMPFTFSTDALWLEVPPAGSAAGADESSVTEVAADAGPRLEVLGSVVHGGSARFGVRGPERGGIRLFDVRGRLVVVLVPAPGSTGGIRTYTWNGRDSGGVPVARGVYFARAEVSGQVLVRRLVWLRE